MLAGRVLLNKPVEETNHIAGDIRVGPKIKITPLMRHRIICSIEKTGTNTNIKVVAIRTLHERVVKIIIKGLAHIINLNHICLQHINIKEILGPLIPSKTQRGRDNIPGILRSLLIVISKRDLSRWNSAPLKNLISKETEPWNTQLRSNAKLTGVCRGFNFRLESTRKAHIKELSAPKEILMIIANTRRDTNKPA